MRQFRTSGSVRGAAREGGPYRDRVQGRSSGSRLSHHVVQRGVGRIGTSQRRKKSAGGRARKEMQYTVPENPPPGDLAWF